MNYHTCLINHMMAIIRPFKSTDNYTEAKEEARQYIVSTNLPDEKKNELIVFLDRPDKIEIGNNELCVLTDEVIFAMRECGYTLLEKSNE